MAAEDLRLTPETMAVLCSSRVIEALHAAGVTLVCRHCVGAGDWMAAVPKGFNGPEDAEWTVTCACRTRRGANPMRQRRSA